MEAVEITHSPEIAGRVLIIDDDNTSRVLLRTTLARRFDVLTATSGEEGLIIAAESNPDLILLDIEMPGMGGYETCRQFRTQSNVPVIFVSANDHIEAQLKAYESGGNDMIAKPVDPKILLQKSLLAIKQKQERDALAQERDTLHEMAMAFLSNVGESGVLLNFMRSSLGCRTDSQLADQLVSSAREYGISSNVRIHRQSSSTIRTSLGDATPLETAILDQAASLGRIFQFGNRLIVNYDHVSILVNNMPDDPEKAGRIRDNISILTESAEALTDMVEMRRESAQRAEQMQLALGNSIASLNQLRERYSEMQIGIHLKLQTLVDNVEKTYSFLGTSQSQEHIISETMYKSTSEILHLLERSSGFESKFEEVINSLKNDDDNSIELF